MKDPALDIIQQREAAKFYPESDGMPIANNTDDVMVAIGRPKGRRSSYMQWAENNIPPQVVFEILSPGNRKQEMADKFAFFQRYGVEEYYTFDPAHGRLNGWLRNPQGRLVAIAEMQNWQSLRLEIRFFLKGLELQIFSPDDSRFLTFLELNQRLEDAEKRVFGAIWEIDQAEVRAGEAERQRELESAARLETEHQRELLSTARQAAEAKAQEMEARLRAAGLL